MQQTPKMRGCGDRRPLLRYLPQLQCGHGRARLVRTTLKCPQVAVAVGVAAAVVPVGTSLMAVVCLGGRDCGGSGSTHLGSSLSRTGGSFSPPELEYDS